MSKEELVKLIREFIYECEPESDMSISPSIDQMIEQEPYKMLRRFAQFLEAKP